MPCLSVIIIELPTILSRLIFFIVHNHVINYMCAALGLYTHTHYSEHNIDFVAHALHLCCFIYTIKIIVHKKNYVKFALNHSMLKRLMWCTCFMKDCRTVIIIARPYMGYNSIQ